MHILLQFSWFLMMLVSISAHDFHLSKTDIHYRSESQSLQVTIHAFIDDTQLALEAIDSLEYKLMEQSEHALADSILGVYLTNNFIVKADGVPLEFNYLGKEASDDIEGLYAYMEVEGLTIPKQLEVTNKILMEQFDDQKNIIKVMMDDDNKAFHLLSKKDHTKSVDF